MPSFPFEPPLQPFQPDNSRVPTSPCPSYSPPDSPSPPRQLNTPLPAYPPHLVSPRFSGDFAGLGLWSHGEKELEKKASIGSEWSARARPPTPPRFGRKTEHDRDLGKRVEKSGDALSPTGSSFSPHLDDDDVFHASIRQQLGSGPPSASSSRLSLTSPLLGSKESRIDFIPHQRHTHGARSDSNLLAGPKNAGGVKESHGRRRFIKYGVVFLGVFTAAVGLVSKLREERLHWGGDQGFRGINLAETVVSSEPEIKIQNKGGDGDVVTLEDGSTFIYVNQFGGTWDSSARGLGARAQSYTPALAERWDYAKNTIAGVNLGGWLTTEPFVTPSLYEPFMDDEFPAIDEWTLSISLGDKLAEVLEEHYKTFITEEDFAEIARAGLNWVRIPLPYWAIETFDDEPFLAHIAWNYFLKAITWARKYGLRLNLDLHTAPGSQNGWNHSGKTGSMGFMNGVMGIANAQRTLNHIRVLAEFLSIPEIAEVVPMFGILNEPQVWVMGDESLRSFYMEAYDTVRQVSGLGEGRGPVNKQLPSQRYTADRSYAQIISIHDSFSGPASWATFLRGADRLALDQHLYFAFRDPNTLSLPQSAFMPCDKWAWKTNMTLGTFGLTTTGEFSVAVNDCGRFLNGVNLGVRFEGTYPNTRKPAFAGVGSCKKWDDYRDWNDEMKEDLKNIAYAHMDAHRNWFYWTWKTGVSLTTNRTTSPLWNYSLGVREGFLPSDPQRALGFCKSNAAVQDKPLREYAWDGKLKPYQTGGVGAGKIDPKQMKKYGTFPPPTLTGGLVASLLPTYTRTGTPVTLKGVPTQAPIKGDDVEMVEEQGWFVPVKGCSYIGPWSGVKAAVPTAACTGA
ncbi:glucan 1,3-beta-glucosidase, partial [Phenoliferia sp. Uapishka_3]